MSPSRRWAPGRWAFGRWAPCAWAALWVALIAAVWVTRPLLPIDETRYASVAWEMWRKADWLLPRVNGQPYPDKPPLLFWLVLIGWKVFGVHAWVLRLVPALFALGAVYLSARLAGELWPERPEVGQTAGWIVLGSVAWVLYGTVVLFDMLMACFTLLALLGLLRAWRRGGPRPWGLVGLALGLGLLAKGPVIFIYVLPAALATPWWGGPRRQPKGRYYPGLLTATLLGLAIVLAWAVPAAHAGGPRYAAAIFWGQTAGRMANSFAHRRPIWWYLALLPIVTAPWSLSPRVWRGARALPGILAERGVRLCLIWFVGGLALFSLISGKQLHYLIPLFPALALLMARVASPEPGERRRWDALPAAAFLLLIGILLLAFPRVMRVATRVGVAPPRWALTVGGVTSIALGLVLLALVVALLIAAVPRGLAGRRQSAALSTATVLTMIALHLGIMRPAAAAYDLGPAARVIARLQAEGRPVANVGRYHAEFQFLGRLREPVAEIPSSDARRWAASHPDGALVTYPDQWPLRAPAALTFAQAYENGALVIQGSREALAGGIGRPPR